MPVAGSGSDGWLSLTGSVGDGDNVSGDGDGSVVPLVALSGSALPPSSPPSGAGAAGASVPRCSGAPVAGSLSDDVVVVAVSASVSSSVDEPLGASFGEIGAPAAAP